MRAFPRIDLAIDWVEEKLVLQSYPLKTEKWQGIDLQDKPQYSMREILNISFQSMVYDKENLVNRIKPNLPWADIHFEERIGGLPLNPGESYKQWPFYKLDDQVRDKLFSHTYMERFWPKFAGNGQFRGFTSSETEKNPNNGIRYEYGDLSDVINLLSKEPHTRQAFLPVWHPEDTGATHGGRVPCTIGYHFIRRDNLLHMVYYIRSCDFIRHFRDDIYLALKLLYYILKELSYHTSWENVTPGWFTMHITSLHCFESDYQILKRNYEKDK
jgi:hypothetical protein